MVNKEQSQEYVSMGIKLMQLEKYSEAKKMFSMACEADSANYDSYVHLGNACVNMNEYENAILSFSTALALKPDSGEVLFNIGNVYYLQDDFRQAIKYYNKAEKIGYQSPDMYLIMAEIFTQAEDPEQSLRCINRALSVAPLRGDIWRRKVSFLLNYGKLDEAEEALDEFLELLPDAFDAYELQANLLCRQKKYNEALNRIHIGIDRFPNDSRLKLIEVHILAEANETDKVKELLRQLKESGTADSFRKAIGLEETRILISEGKGEEAIKAVEWSLELNPDDADLLFLLLSVYIGRLDYKNILSVAERIQKTGVSDPTVIGTARFYRALSMKELGEKAQGEAELRKLAKDLRKITIENPGLTNLYMIRLLCHCTLNEYEKAFQLADYLQSISPDSASGHAYRHLIYKQMGDEKKAEEELAEARKIDPNVAG